MARRLPNAPNFKTFADVTKYLNDLVKLSNQQTLDLAASTNTETNLLSTSLISISGDYTAGNRSVILADASAGPLTVTLKPAKDYYRDIFCVKKVNPSTNAVTVQVSGGGTIDSASTVVLSAAGEPSVVMISNGVEYKILAQGT